MPIEYVLHLSKSRRGFHKPRIGREKAMLAGHLEPGTNEIVGPDQAAVRAALPHYYRKAFDRSGIRFWFREERGSGRLRPAYMTLYSKRMKYLNTVYAIPVVKE